MKRVIEAALAAGLLALSTSFTSDNSGSAAHVACLGFDRNDYPGDSSLKLLRGKFSFAGFWLNNPPGASSNSWTGKRRVVQELGFGFLVVFNGRTFAQIRAAADATKLGASDGAMAVSSARREGFPARTIIFLDQEEGGRLLPEQRVYLHAWVDAVQSAGFRAGVYCSGIAFKEGSGATVITAGCPTLRGFRRVGAGSGNPAYSRLSTGQPTAPLLSPTASNRAPRVLTRPSAPPPTQPPHRNVIHVLDND